MKKRDHKNIIQSRKEQMAESLKLPKDLVLGAAITSIMGCDEVFIENYKGIIECCKESVIVQTKTCRIHFSGCNLCVEYYTDEEMKLTGHIGQINFYD